MKYAADKNTHIFGWYGPDVLELSGEQVRWYKDLGYDMDAWLRGESLSINGKYPISREKEAMKMVMDAIDRDRSATAAPSGTFAPPPQAAEGQLFVRECQKTFEKPRKFA
jgi:hypothetical protein